MKASSIIAAVLIFSASLYCTQAFAQSSGVAADKQKQQNLEKNKARQKEMQKKYNALSPQEKAAAEKRANEYKNSGGKTTGKGTTTKPAAPAKPAASSAKTTQAKPAAKNSTTKATPVFMDANGKPLNKTTAPAAPATKPATKTTPKATTPKTTTPAAESASERVKK